jgi:PPOX class probable F420-dependent enzyme
MPAETMLTARYVAFLNEQDVAHLATVDGRGRPHAVPVCYAVYNGALYTPVDEKPKRADAPALRRVRNITANQQVCLVVDRYDAAWAHLAWLQVHGVATLVSEAAERAGAIAALRQRYHQYRTMDLESRPLIRIVPVRVNAWSIDGSL